MTLSDEKAINMTTIPFQCCRRIQHDDVIKWKHLPRYWPFVRGIHRSPMNSQHKGQWRGALMFSLICVWINGWVNNREAGDLRRHRGHYDVTVMRNRYHPTPSLRYHWKPWVVMMTILPSLTAPEAVMTNSGTASGNCVDIMTILGFADLHCNVNFSQIGKMCHNDNLHCRHGGLSLVTTFWFQFCV